MAPGKQNETAACPKDKVQFKFFSSPETCCDMNVIRITVFIFLLLNLANRAIAFLCPKPGTV